MVKKRVHTYPVTRWVQAFLTLNAGTNGEAADMARAIFGMLTGYNPGGYTVGGSLDQAIAYLENDYMEALVEATKVLAITQILIMLAGALGLPRKTRVVSTRTDIYYVQWW